MRIPRSLVYGLLGAVVVIFVAVWIIRRGQAVETVQVMQGPLVQTVVTTGRVADNARTEVASQTTSRIEQILVREGDRVQPGQILIRLRDDEAQANARQALSTVAEARLRIRQIQTVLGPVTALQFEQAVATNRQAQQELARTQELVRQGFVSQSRLDDMVRAAQFSHAALLAAQAVAESNKPTGAELALAQARLDQTTAAQHAATARLDALTLRAPVAATVIGRANDPGDTAQPGKSILTLVSGTELRIHASVDEKNLKYIKIDQLAKATPDAFPDQHFEASLIHIAPAVDPQRGTVEVRLRINSPAPYLRTDMTVSVEILTAQIANGLLLPTGALRKDAAGAHFVLQNQEGKVHRVPVKIGLQGAGTTEITEGLRKGDSVILPGPLIEEGDRVREQAAAGPRGNMQPIPGLTN